MKIAVVLGTRPEIIKLSSIIRELQNKRLNFFIIHTRQHYNPLMDQVFFQELALPKCKYGLKIGSNSHAKQTGKMLVALEEILQQEKVTCVFVQGDTNTTLAGALSASKIPGIKVAHVEAGLRSYDKRMPEEINRIVTDHLSHYLFAPCEGQKKILIKEGINKKNIFVTGNTIVDAINYYLPYAKRLSKIVKINKLQTQKYILFTLHRPENVDNKNRLKEIFYTLDQISQISNLPIIFPIHPRTDKQVKKFSLKIPKNIKVIKPLGFFDFLLLEANSRLILTDSGGVQEEACILKVPCVTLRENTERPETVEVGANLLGGVHKKSIIKAFKIMLQKSSNWENPFGKGNAGKKIVSVILRS